MAIALVSFLSCLSACPVNGIKGRLRELVSLSKRYCFSLTCMFSWRNYWDVLKTSSAQLPCCIIILYFSEHPGFLSGGCKLIGGLPYIHGQEGQPLVSVPSYLGRKRQFFMATEALRHLSFSSQSLEETGSTVFDVSLWPVRTYYASI